MKYSEKGNVFVVKIEPGEEILEKMIKFCERTGVKSAFFTGIGALRYAEIGMFSKEGKNYLTRTFDEELELANMTGNISEHEKEPVIHTHVMIGDKNMNAYAGHLMKGVVSVTCEIFVTVIDGDLKRGIDFETQLKLLDLE